MGTIVIDHDPGYVTVASHQFEGTDIHIIIERNTERTFRSYRITRDGSRLGVPYAFYVRYHRQTETAAREVASQLYYQTCRDVLPFLPGSPFNLGAPTSDQATLELCRFCAFRGLDYCAGDEDMHRLAAGDLPECDV